MKSTKNDVRSRFTQSTIKKSLLKLLNNAPLKSITVSELCREAGITRGTFYNHFYDVYDIYESIENEFFETIAAKLDGKKTYALDYDFFLEIMTLFAENPDVTALIVSNPHENLLLKKIISFVRDKYITEFTEKFTELDHNIIETLYAYSSNGSISAIAEWFQKGKPVPLENMARFIGEFNKIIISGCSEFQRYFK